MCPTVRMSQNHAFSTNSIHRYCLSLNQKLLFADARNVALILEFKLIQIGEILAPASVIVNVWPPWSCNKRLQSALLFIAMLTPSNGHQGVICLSVLSGRVQWRINFTTFAFFLLPSCNGGLRSEIRGKSSSCDVAVSVSAAYSQQCYSCLLKHILKTLWRIFLCPPRCFVCHISLHLFSFSFLNN